MPPNLDKMEIIKLLKAVFGGKSREEIYNMLSPQEKETLNKLAAANGINRRQRRQLERNARKRIHRQID